jgi:uncharacterized protein (DUF1778 family)
MALHIRNIPDDAHRHIKVAAALSGQTMEQFVVEAAYERAKSVVKLPIPAAPAPKKG